MSRPVPKKLLAWGETPWDDMTREDLLREVQRMYSALRSAQSIVLMMKGDSHPSGFWAPDAVGGQALGKITYTLAPYTDRGPYSESIYRTFFRYADDLLFPGVAGVVDGWHVCDKGHMIASDKPEDVAACIDCQLKGEDRPMRPLEWRDLDPKAAT